MIFSHRLTYAFLNHFFKQKILVMGSTIEKTIEILNDLILINSDRSTAYEKAMKLIAVEDSELAQIFKTMASDSRKYLYELAGHLDPSGQEFLKVIPPTSGRVYQKWTGEKNSFIGKDRYSLLSSSELEEKAIENAYNEVMKEELPEEIKNIIAEQKNNLQKSYDRIRSMQQMQHA